MSETGRVAELQDLKRVAQAELIKLLEEFIGNKDLIIEDTLMKPLDRIAGATLLRAHGVDKIFKLDLSAPRLTQNQAQIIFIVRATIRNARAIADAVNEHRSHRLATSASHPKRPEVGVIFVPRTLHACLAVFEQNGVMGDLRIEHFNPDLIPLDSDFLSLEIPQYFRSFFVDGCLDQIWPIAHSLWHLQSLFGPVSHLIGIGRSAERALAMMQKLYWEYGEARARSDYLFSHLFLVDRDVDFAPVFLSCLTYESLLDETFEVQCGVVEFPGEVVKQEKNVKILLTSADEVFDGIRNRHFSTVIPLLSAKVREVQQGYDKRNTSDVGKLKQFVAQDLQGLRAQHRSVALHIGACETIMNRKKRQDFEAQIVAEHSLMTGGAYKDSLATIEDMMAQQVTEQVPLSLMCLLSLTQQGLPAKDYQSLRTQFFHAYGYQCLGAFAKLKRLGILVDRESTTARLPISIPSAAQTSHIPSNVGSASQSTIPTSNFPMLVKRLGLQARSDEVNIRTPTDFSYVYNGAYVPAIAQIVSQSLQTGFASVEAELRRALPGYPITYRSSAKPSVVDSSKIVMVYFLGGVTYAEIACLRLLAKMKGYKIVIATTNVITRGGLWKELQEL